MDDVVSFLGNVGLQPWLGAAAALVGWELCRWGLRKFRAYAKSTATLVDDRLADSLESKLRRIFRR